MKRYKKIIVKGGLVLCPTLPLMSAGCFDSFNPATNNSEWPGPNNPNENPSVGIELPEQEGYITFKSKNEIYLKSNNIYHMPDLDYKDEVFSSNVFIDELYKDFNPRYWRSLDYLALEKHKEEPIYKSGRVTDTEFTSEPEDACKLQNLIRLFYRTKFNTSLSNYTPQETYKTFIRKFGEHFSELCKERITQAELDHQQNYYQSIITGDELLEPFKEPDSKISAGMMAEYGQTMSVGWKSSGQEAYRRFLLPFTIGQNSKLKQFKIKHDDMYNDPNCYSETYGIKMYDNWNPLVFLVHTLSKLTSQTKLQLKFYNRFLKFLESLIGLQKGHVVKWSELDESNPNAKNVEVCLEFLTQGTVDLLSWKNMLLSESEEFDKRDETMTNIFACGSEHNDFQNSWIFAYEILNDVIVPFYAISGWSIPVELDNFDLEISNKEWETYYIYRLAANYLNRLIQKNYSDKNDDYYDRIKTIRITPYYVKNRTNSGIYKTKFLEFMKNWSSYINIGIGWEDI